MAPETRLSRILERIGEPDLRALFGHRAARSTIANWKAGRRALPPWAKEILRQRWRFIAAETARDIEQIKTGPGLKAGARNLAEYLARRT
jgi:hypothetical protein